MLCAPKNALQHLHEIQQQTGSRAVFDHYTKSGPPHNLLWTVRLTFYPCQKQLGSGRIDYPFGQDTAWTIDSSVERQPQRSKKSAQKWVSEELLRRYAKPLTQLTATIVDTRPVVVLTDKTAKLLDMRPHLQLYVGKEHAHRLVSLDCTGTVVAIDTEGHRNSTAKWIQITNGTDTILILPFADCYDELRRFLTSPRTNKVFWGYHHDQAKVPYQMVNVSDAQCLYAQNILHQPITPSTLPTQTAFAKAMECLFCNNQNHIVKYPEGTNKDMFYTQFDSDVAEELSLVHRLYMAGDVVWLWMMYQKVCG